MLFVQEYYNQMMAHIVLLFLIDYSVFLIPHSALCIECISIVTVYIASTELFLSICVVVES